MLTNILIELLYIFGWKFSSKMFTKISQIKNVSKLL